MQIKANIKHGKIKNKNFGMKLVLAKFRPFKSTYIHTPMYIRVW